MLNCSGSGLTSLDQVQVPQDTTWLLAASNNITTLCTWPGLDLITHLDLHSSHIATICEDFYQVLNQSSHIKYINLANNNISVFSKALMGLKTLERVYVAGNPVQCTCDSLWFTDWLVNFTSPSGVRLVQDYSHVTCAAGDASWVGTPVHRLDPVQMGCFPKTLAK